MSPRVHPGSARPGHSPEPRTAAARSPTRQKSAGWVAGARASPASLHAPAPLATLAPGRPSTRPSQRAYPAESPLSCYRSTECCAFGRRCASASWPWSRAFAPDRSDALCKRFTTLTRGLCKVKIGGKSADPSLCMLCSRCPSRHRRVDRASPLAHGLTIGSMRQNLHCSWQIRMWPRRLQFADSGDAQQKCHPNR